MNKTIKYIILFIIGYLVYKYFSKTTPSTNNEGFDVLDPQNPNKTFTPNNKTKEKEDTFCTDLLTTPRAFGQTVRNDLPIIGSYGYDAINKGQFELMPMASATDLPYTFTVQNLATKRYYTHYHGTNPNGGWGTGGYVGRSGSPTTKFKDLPAGDYKWTVTTKSGCKQSTIRTLG